MMCIRARKSLSTYDKGRTVDMARPARGRRGVERLAFAQAQARIRATGWWRMRV
jgi:hypothetical protein